MHKGIVVTSCLTAVLLLGAAAAVPQEAMEQEGEQGEMPPEMQAMMAAWQKAGALQEQHKGLAESAGNWEFSATFWMQPGGEPMTTTGTSERTMLMGGRVLKEKVTSEMMGEPFEGMALVGYDNLRQEYWSTWMDNMSTSVMMMRGQCTESACNFFGSYKDPVTGQTKTSRSTIQYEGDKELHRAYEYQPDGTEWKSMEFVYTRKR